MQRLSLQAKLRTMKLLLTSAGLLATLLQAGCGSNGSGDAAAAADPDAALKEAACACLQEMDAVVADLIATGQKENWEARRWNEELGARTVPCAVRKESHEETLKWIEFQQACEAYPAYSEKLAVVSQKLQDVGRQVAVRAQGSETTLGRPPGGLKQHGIAAESIRLQDAS